MLQVEKPGFSNLLEITCLSGNMLYNNYIFQKYVIILCLSCAENVYREGFMFYREIQRDITNGY